MTTPHPGLAPTVAHYNDNAYRNAIVSGQQLLDILGDVQTGREVSRTAVEAFPLAGLTARTLRGNDTDVDDDLRNLMGRVQDHLDALAQTQSRAHSRYENSLADHQRWEHRYQSWRTAQEST